MIVPDKESNAHFTHNNFCPRLELTTRTVENGEKAENPVDDAKRDLNPKSGESGKSTKASLPIAAPSVTPFFSHA